MNTNRNRKFLVLFLILCLAVSFIPRGKAMANGAPVITPGTNPWAVFYNEAKLLSFSGGPGAEVLLGKAGLLEGERVQVDFSGGATMKLNRNLAAIKPYSGLQLCPVSLRRCKQQPILPGVCDRPAVSA
jgi:hypothetical protein